MQENTQNGIPTPSQQSATVNMVELSTLTITNVTIVILLT